VSDLSPPQSGHVRLTGRLICRSGTEARTVRQHLPEHLRLTRLEPGCLSFDVTQGDDPMIWHVAETFRDAEAFAAHQTRTRASAWWAATAQILRDFTVTGLPPECP
jgi:quinol monooxygenase YgiN